MPGCQAHSYPQFSLTYLPGENNMSNFGQWLKDYEKIEVKYGPKGVIIPERYYETLLQQYLAYRMFKENRKLVNWTLTLAIATIILALITLLK